MMFRQPFFQPTLHRRPTEADHPTPMRGESESAAPQKVRRGSSAMTSLKLMVKFYNSSDLASNQRQRPLPTKRDHCGNSRCDSPTATGLASRVARYDLESTWTHRQISRRFNFIATMVDRSTRARDVSFCIWCTQASPHCNNPAFRNRFVKLHDRRISRI